MSEKTTLPIDYIKASITILESKNALNGDEIAVLCNLKKFIYQSERTE
ncbi:hypothetical protein [Enterococcus sp. AZ189]